MMKSSLSNRDYELISAYLDGEVDARQKKAIEMRLGHDPQFKSAYEQLWQTRWLLRSQAALRAPRNYLLSPKMIAASQTSASPFFSFAALLRPVSALVSILFLILFGLNWFSAGRMMSAPPMENSKMLYQQAPVEMAPAQPTPSGTTAEDEQPMAKSMATTVPNPQAIAPPMIEGGGGMGAGEGGEGAVEAPLLEPYSATLLMAPTETITATLLPETTEEIVASQDQTEAETLQSSLAESEETETGFSSGQAQTGWLIKQVLFGFLAIFFAFLAIRLRKVGS